MHRVAAIAALLLGSAVVVPREASAQPVCEYGKGTVYQLKSVNRTHPLTQVDTPVPVASGYSVNVSVNGGPNHTVLVDTGSNLLVVPYNKVRGFPSDPDVVASGSMVVSNLLHYSYGSSGISYRGYLVNVPVTINRVPAKAAIPSAPTIPNMTVYAVTQSCGVDGQCVPVTENSPIGMMGVGFQPTPYLVLKNGSVATHTNAFAEIPNVPAVGYIFGPDGITVGLNEAVTKGIIWASLDGAGRANGCLTITSAKGSPGKPLCGTMLLDTGVEKMFAWIGPETQPPTCPKPGGTAKEDGGTGKADGGSAHAGFVGVPFPEGTTIQISSPAESPSMSYSFTVGGGDAGTPKPVLCLDSMEPHSNIGRMPLQRFSYARNESCKAFGFRKNP
jgi:hypothetical protein